MPQGRVDLHLCHAVEDTDLLADLCKHLSVLERSEKVRIFHAGMVGTGADVRAVMDGSLDGADLVLLLVSADFLASEDCDRDARRALARQAAGQARVLPVLLHDCDYRAAAFGELKALPKNGRPVGSWTEPNEALADVARGVREAVDENLASAARRASAGPRASGPKTSRASVVQLLLQVLRRDDATGAALLAPFGFQAHQIAGEVLHRLHEPGEPLFPVRLVPELRETTEEQLYRRLLRDLRWAVPEAWRTAIDAHATEAPMDAFEYALDDLLRGPAMSAGRKLLLVIDGLASVPTKQLEEWGYLLARLTNHGIRLFAWGGQELYDLRTRSESKRHFSAFHVLKPVTLGGMSSDEVRQLLVSNGGDAAAATALFEVTGGHPAMVQEVMDNHPEDACCGDRDVLEKRILYGDHFARLSGKLKADPAALAVFRELSARCDASLPRTGRRAEERLRWLGVLREAGVNAWEWTAPVMRRLAAEP